MSIAKTVLLTLFSMIGLAFASPVNTSFDAVVEIVAPIELQITPMSFGSLIKPVAGRESHQAVSAVLITGGKNKSVQLTLASDVTIYNGSDTLLVTLSLPTNEPVLDAQGEYRLDITGELDIRSNTKVGTYSGSTVMTAAYL